jgi:hypothetical protein
MNLIYKAGASDPAIQYMVTGVSLTGASAAARFYDAARSLVVSVAATIEPMTNGGVLVVAPPPQVRNSPGLYLLDFAITYSSGNLEVVPGRNMLILTVLP